MSRPKQILSMLLLALLVGVPVGLAVAFLPAREQPVAQPASRATPASERWTPAPTRAVPVRTATPVPREVTPAEYAFAHCAALEYVNRARRESTDARAAVALGARSALPTPPAVYRAMHAALVRLLESIMFASGASAEQSARAALVVALDALGASARSTFDRACAATLDLP